MYIIVFGRPLVFWIGLIAFASLLLQIYLGLMLAKGKNYLFKYHRINAFVLLGIVLFHFFLALALYL